MNKCIRTLLTLILVLGMQPLYAQLKLQVDVPKTVDISEDYFQIRFTVNALNVNDFTPPSLSDFEVLSGPSTSIRSSSSSINGRTTRDESTTYTYMLAPKSKGKFTIGAATATVKGKKVRSSEKTVEVVGDGKPRAHSRQQQPENNRVQRAGERITENDLFIKVIANRKKIYEQEPILLTYKFYAKTGVGLNNIGLHKKPDFKGMLSQDIPVNEIELDVENINGVPYRTGVIQRYVIFPQKTGKITVPGVTFDCYVIQQDHSIDIIDAFFNGGGTITRTVQRTVKDVDLEILPLPEPKPTNFSGGVGQFFVKGELLNDEFKTNDVATYRVTIEGTGNLKLIPSPKFELPSDFDVYSPKTTESTSVTEDGTTGKITYDYTFVPRNIGDYTIPVIDLNYFDPVAESYVTTSTEPLTFHVEKGSRSNEEYERVQGLQRSDIRDIHNSEGSVTPYDKLIWWGDFSYWSIYLLIIVIALVSYRLLQRYVDVNADVISRRSRKAGKMAVRRMKKAKIFMDANKRSDFYAEVSHALYDYVADKYNIGTAELNRTNIEAEFRLKGVEESAISDFLHLLDECDFAQYAPSDQVMPMNEMYDHSVKSIVDIENQKISKKS